MDEWRFVVIWITHFIPNFQSSIPNPTFLIMDNHSSHMLLSSYNFCKGNDITVISIPPNTSHKMQPLNTSFFGPVMPFWHNKGRFGTSGLHGNQSNYCNEVGKQTQIAPCVATLFWKWWASSFYNCSKLLLFIEKHEEMLTHSSLPLYNP
jgi:hypothetical protein